MSLYIPKHFSSDDQQRIKSLIRENPFAMLISQHQQQLVISHLPINQHADGKLYGHLARANPHSQIEGPATLVFSGPHAYISPNWMASEVNVPTWNYATVHLQGVLKFIDDPQRSWEILKELTEVYEGPEGWQLPEQQPYLKMPKALRVFEFQVSHIEAKFKWSQNKSGADRALIIQNLQQRGETAAAEQMSESIPEISG